MAVLALFPFFQQTFAWVDIPRILLLGFLEWILSADNIIVLAVLVKPFSEKLQKKALFIGIISAFFLRMLAITAASFILRLSWVELAGALYLLFLCMHYFFSRKKRGTFSLKDPAFWKAVVAIELIDLSFALDSIVAGLAFIAPFGSSHAPINPKLWIVFMGAIIGIIGVRYAAHLFTLLLKRFPKLERSTYLLIGWIGLRLFFDGLFKLFGLNLDEFPWQQPLFWIGTVFFLMLGFQAKIKVKTHGK